MLVHTIEGTSFIKFNCKLCHCVESIVIRERFCLVSAELVVKHVSHEKQSETRRLISDSLFDDLLRSLHLLIILIQNDSFV